MPLSLRGKSKKSSTHGREFIGEENAVKRRAFLDTRENGSTARAIPQKSADGVGAEDVRLPD